MLKLDLDVASLAARTARSGAPVGGSPSLAPSPTWDGTPASGFQTVPIDPVRTTAKPACQLVTVPRQRFTSRHWIGALAFANDGGTLIGGIDRVRFHFEGESLDVLTPTFRTFDDANGNPVTYLAYWCELAKPIEASGEAVLYVEAIPADATMQRRRIGPFSYFLFDTQHDLELEVAPSQSETATRFRNLNNALAAIRNAAAQHPRIVIIEPGDHWISNPGVSYNPAGYTTIEATAPVTITKPSRVFGQNDLRTRHSGLHLRGSNITLDFVNFLTTYSENGRNCEHWFDGVTLTNSAGRNDLWFKFHRDAANTLHLIGNPYMTECMVTNLNRPIADLTLARGCSTSSDWGDVARGTKALIGNTSQDFDSSFYTAFLPALTVGFGGTEATATLEMSGGTNSLTRTITARVNGAVVGTFAASRANAASNFYNMSDVVNWINGLPGWTATLLDDTRVATSLQMEGAVGAWSGFDAKAGGTLYSFFDIHPDYSQTNGENVIIYGNIARNMKGFVQIMHFTDAECLDFFCINNAFDMEASIAVSNQNRVHSHVVIVHNTMTAQAMNLRTDQIYDPDGHSMIAANSFKGITWAAAPDDDQTIKDNHLHAGSTAPEGATGTTIGGNPADLYINAAAGDFTPAGTLADNLKPRLFEWDIRGSARATNDAAGAVSVDGSG
ncbi:MAG: hypothetical protein V2J14_11885 [Erythrobacter sp.]|jgi:hypothetical protein|nr:hypothetical protein [Erythrobacter sp.]